MPKNISFRIRRIYFHQIVEGTKTFEIRPSSPYWDKKFIGNGSKEQNRRWENFINGQAVFVCGKDVHRRRIVDIRYGHPHMYLGRELSEQGKKDIPTEFCYCIKLGEVVEKGGNP